MSSPSRLDRHLVETARDTGWNSDPMHKAAPDQTCSPGLTQVHGANGPAPRTEHPGKLNEVLVTRPSGGNLSSCATHKLRAANNSDVLVTANKKICEHLADSVRHDKYLLNEENFVFSWWFSHAPHSSAEQRVL